MKTSKTYDISGYVVSPSNISELANRINGEYRKDIESSKEKDRKTSVIKFTLRNEDGTQYESQDITALSENGILSTRRIIEVEILYFSLVMEKSISLRLYHSGKESSYSSVTITGEDEIWTNGILSAIKDIVSGWRKQKTWPERYRIPIILVSGAMIGASLLIIGGFLMIQVFRITHLYDSLLKQTPEVLKALTPFIIIYVSFAYLKIGVEIADSIWKKICALFPSVELVTGPEYSQSESQKRKKLIIIISKGILPILISILVALFF